MTFRKLTPLLLCTLFISGGTFAGSCGSGKVVKIEEGGFDTDNLYIKIDYSVAQSDHPGSEIAGFVVYQSTLGDRLNGIRSLALAALMAGKTVRAWSHNDDCSAVTNLNIVP